MKKRWPYYLANAPLQQVQRLCRSTRQVDDPPFRERPPVIDPHHDAPAIGQIRHLHQPG